MWYISHEVYRARRREKVMLNFDATIAQQTKVCKFKIIR